MYKRVLRTKSFLFAISIIDLYKDLKDNHREYVLSKQILRSGTSVGAMIRESEFSESKLDFIHKLAIAQKEINETIYWLELLNTGGFITNDSFNTLNESSIEIIKMLTSSIKTVKSSIAK
ncbi:MAG TPA: four helix bundle protein [Saprospiraceae bacterium]|nr:four helix bundle protein [Saprospiraceae bacterium]